MKLPSYLQVKSLCIWPPRIFRPRGIISIYDVDSPRQNGQCRWDLPKKEWTIHKTEMTIQRKSDIFRKYLCLHNSSDKALKVWRGFIWRRVVLRAKDVATGVSFVPIVPLRKKRREPLSDHKGNKTRTKMTATEKLLSLVNDDLYAGCKMFLLSFWSEQGKMMILWF